MSNTPSPQSREELRRAILAYADRVLNPKERDNLEALEQFIDGYTQGLVAEAAQASLQQQIHDYVKGDITDPVGVARTAAMMLVSILCADTNATKATLELKGLTWKDKKLGDWRVTVQRLSVPKEDS